MEYVPETMPTPARAGMSHGCVAAAPRAMAVVLLAFPMAVECKNTDACKGDNTASPCCQRKRVRAKTSLGGSALGNFSNGYVWVSLVLGYHLSYALYSMLPLLPIVGPSGGRLLPVLSSKHCNESSEVLAQSTYMPPQSPELGDYEGTDPSVIAQHLAWSRQAKINLWVTG
eukprot:scaffold79760_cov57-Attheya_sp.AAC.4